MNREIENLKVEVQLKKGAATRPAAKSQKEYVRKNIIPYFHEQHEDILSKSETDEGFKESNKHTLCKLYYLTQLHPKPEKPTAQAAAKDGPKVVDSDAPKIFRVNKSVSNEKLAENLVAKITTLANTNVKNKYITNCEMEGDPTLNLKSNCPWTAVTSKLNKDVVRKIVDDNLAAYKDLDGSYVGQMEHFINSLAEDVMEAQKLEEACTPSDDNVAMLQKTLTLFMGFNANAKLLKESWTDWQAADETRVATTVTDASPPQDDNKIAPFHIPHFVKQAASCLDAPKPKETKESDKDSPDSKKSRKNKRSDDAAPADEAKKLKLDDEPEASGNAAGPADMEVEDDA